MSYRILKKKIALPFALCLYSTDVRDISNNTPNYRSISVNYTRQKCNENLKVLWKYVRCFIKKNMPFVSLESSETYEDRIKSFGLTRKKYDINFRYFSISPCKDYTLVPPVLQCLDPFFINAFIQVCKKRVRRCDDFGIGFKIVPSKKFFEVWKEAEVRRDQVG